MIDARYIKKFDSIKQARDEAQGRVSVLESQVNALESEEKALTVFYETNAKVLDVLKVYAMAKEQKLKAKIDNVVTKGLQLILGKDYESKLEFGISRGQAVIKPKIVSKVNGEELETTVLDSHGGGIANIMAVIYQMIVLALRRPQLRQVLFLDEPFKNVSEQYLEATASFLKQLNKQLGIQIVLITHQKQHCEIADVMYEFSLGENGLTHIERKI